MHSDHDGTRRESTQHVEGKQANENGLGGEKCSPICQSLEVEYLETSEYRDCWTTQKSNAKREFRNSLEVIIQPYLSPAFPVS